MVCIGVKILFIIPCGNFVGFRVKIATARKEVFPCSNYFGNLFFALF
jgi:hypothetical protein